MTRINITAGRQTVFLAADRPATASRLEALPPAQEKSIRLPKGTTPEFDAYVMVDWSASARPKSGADSIWWVVMEWEDGALVSRKATNPSTRLQAEANLKRYLREAVDEGMSVLIGFDFPFGYPAGLAKYLELEGAPWKAIWEYVEAKIKDNQRAGGTNNRFEVAAEMNRLIGKNAPFWGHHPLHRFVGLTPDRPPEHSSLARLRRTEQFAKGAKSAWQLNGAGCVGGQVLMGLPTLHRLVTDEKLAQYSSVWPFETGASLPSREEGKARIIHAEIYPSLEPVQAAFGQVKDEAQVIGLARAFARRDAASEIRSYFESPARQASSEQELDRILQEEGWILGV